MSSASAWAEEGKAENSAAMRKKIDIVDTESVGHDQVGVDGLSSSEMLHSQLH